MKILVNRLALLFLLAQTCLQVQAADKGSLRTGPATSGTGLQHTNRLIKESSPYLIEHAHNPVNWYPWGPEAIAKAKRENKPILLSIGFRACHWCHVMERESFTDPATAQLMNESFINILVDREQRPDIDNIYIKAVEEMSGRPGWPLTVFLTPELKPFYGGTYFPPQDTSGMPSFQRVLLGIRKAWLTDGEKLQAGSNQITKKLIENEQIKPQRTALNQSLLQAAINNLIPEFDQEFGGIRKRTNTRKYPQPSTLDLSMRCAQGSLINQSGVDVCRKFFCLSLEKMAQGGIHDQIGGGFARYAVDRQWQIPHFEKMLGDNALLASSYLNGYLITGRAYWSSVARDTLNFVLADLSSPDGGFYSSLDADSEGQEGKYYLFTPEQITKILGQRDGQWINEILGISRQGNFEDGTSVPHLVDSPESLAKRYGMSLMEFWKRFSVLQKQILQARRMRVAPAIDNKVLTCDNALMISSLVDGYKVLGDPHYLQAATRAQSFLLKHMLIKDHLLRSWSGRQAQFDACLDDYALSIQSLLDLSSADPNPQWLHKAQELTDIMLRHFWDNRNHVFFYTGDKHELIVTRIRNNLDDPVPSGTSVATMDLLRLADISARPDYRQKAQQVLQAYANKAKSSPSDFAYLLCALDYDLSPHSEIVLVSDPAHGDGQELAHCLYKYYMPETTVLLKHPSNKSQAAMRNPILESPAMLNGKSTVYICKNYACDRPITDLITLKQKLESLYGIPKSSKDAKK